MRCSWLQCQPGRQAGVVFFSAGFHGEMAASWSLSSLKCWPNKRVPPATHPRGSGSSRPALPRLAQVLSLHVCLANDRSRPAVFRSERTSGTGSGRSWSFVEIFLRNSIIIFFFSLLFPLPNLAANRLLSIFPCALSWACLCFSARLPTLHWSSLLVINLTGR